MAFSADELRVLRRALATALHSTHPITGTPGWTEDVQDFLRLNEAVDEAAREGGRLRSFLAADLIRYRDALPGAVGGYLNRLDDALAAGYLPDPDDLAALRQLRGRPCGTEEYRRRTAVLRRCEGLAEQDVRQRFTGRAALGRPRSAVREGLRLLALPGGRPAGFPAAGPWPSAAADPPDPPDRDGDSEPPRKVPTPAEIWPPRRTVPKPEEAPPPPGPEEPERRAAG